MFEFIENVEISSMQQHNKLKTNETQISCVITTPHSKIIPAKKSQASEVRGPYKRKKNCDYYCGKCCLWCFDVISASELPVAYYTPLVVTIYMSLVLTYDYLPFIRDGSYNVISFYGCYVMLGVYDFLSFLYSFSVFATTMILQRDIRKQDFGYCVALIFFEIVARVCVSKYIPELSLSFYW